MMHSINRSIIIIITLLFSMLAINSSPIDAHAWHYTSTPKVLRGTWYRHGHRLKVTKYQFGTLSGKKQFVGPQGNHLNGSQLYVSKHRRHGYWLIGKSFTDDASYFKRGRRHGRAVLIQKIANLGNASHPYLYYYYYKR